MPSVTRLILAYDIADDHHCALLTGYLSIGHKGIVHTAKAIASRPPSFSTT
jgi:hypothetical protein